MKINKIFFVTSVFLLALASCQSIKEGLSGSKKNNSDEFLIEKKNPLTKPPDYEKLPVPDMEKTQEEKNKVEDFNLKKILGQPQKNTKKNIDTKSESSNLEKSILEKIKNN